MGAFIVYALAYDDSGSMIRPVGHSDGWGVTAEQLEKLYRYCEERGIPCKPFAELMDVARAEQWIGPG